MSQQANIQHPVHEFIQKRWSPRAFADRPVEISKLLSILEAARWAPSCFNEQPWFFIVATQNQPEEYQKLLDCLTPGNQTWAKSAPVLMLSVASLKFTHNDKPNRHAQHDVGLAAQNLVLEALHQDLYVHQMGGFDVQKSIEVFQIPEGYEPMAAIAIGYLGAAEQLPDDLKAREVAERTRKPMTEFIFSGKWDQTWSVCKK